VGFLFKPRQKQCDQGIGIGIFLYFSQIFLPSLLILMVEYVNE